MSISFLLCPILRGFKIDAIFSKRVRSKLLSSYTLRRYFTSFLACVGEVHMCVARHISPLINEI